MIIVIVGRQFTGFLRGWRVRESNPVGGETSRTRPNRPWGSPSLLYNGYRAPFPGVKRPGRCVNHPLLPSAEVKENVELQLYSPFSAFMACSRAKFTIIITILKKCQKNIASDIWGCFSSGRRYYIIFTTKMVAVFFTEIIKTMYQTTRWYIPGHHNINFHSRISLKYQGWILLKKAL